MYNMIYTATVHLNYIKIIDGQVPVLCSWGSKEPILAWLSVSVFSRFFVVVLFDVVIYVL